MKRVKHIILTLLLSVLSSPFIYSTELSIKFSGGLSYLSMKTINRSLQDWGERNKQEALNTENWNFIGGEVKKFHYGFDLEGEIMLSLSSHFAASFGVGYTYSELTEKKSSLTISNQAQTHVYALPTKVNALPITLSGYYFFPLRKELKLFIKGGGGLIWAKYIDRIAKKKISAEKFTYNPAQRASARGSIFHAGLGIMYELEEGLSFFVEGSARLAKISGFRGEEDTGTLFYIEEYIPDIDFWQAKIVILDEEPSGEDFRSVQKAVFDFSGFSVKIGLLIKF